MRIIERKLHGKYENDNMIIITLSRQVKVDKLE